MQRSLIFKNRGKLSPKHVPRSLPHREKQIDFLLNLYRNALENIQEDHLLSSQHVGPVGTGKAIAFYDINMIQKT